MKTILSIYLLLLVSFCQAQTITHILTAINTQRANKTGGTIPTSGAFTILFDTLDNLTVQDLRTVLSGYTTAGKTVTIQKVPIGVRTGQEFYISANSTNVSLQYTTPQSLDNAVYTYLDMLNIHWYGSGDNWLFKPTTLNNVTIAGEWKSPTFRNRGFDGTGGLDEFIAMDSINNFKKEWYQWKKRIRINSDFEAQGHAGTEFYLANSALCDAHPEWFNSTSGKLAGRIRIEVDSAVIAFKAWATTRKVTRAGFSVIGVDPEDGRGGSDDPLPPDGFQGKNNWNHSDKWWWLANEVAKMYNENDNHTVINMLAYGDGAFNALVPTIALRKNIYPLITPYAFQTAYIPDLMVKKWGDSIKGKMSLYDYANITQYSLGVPQYNMYSLNDKLRFWNANKIDGLQFETTDAGGPMGHIFWIGSELQWDLTKNVDTLYTKYLNDCFGAAAPAMRKMYTRWSLNYQGNADVDFSLQNLAEATSLVTVNSPEWKRINELKAYIHFVKLINGADGTYNNMVNIFNYIYRIHHLRMVQTSAFQGQNYVAPYYQRPSSRGIVPITPAEIETQFNADVAAISVNYTVSPFVFNLDNVTYTQPIDNLAYRFGKFIAASFFKATFTGNVSIDFGGQTPNSVCSIDIYNRDTSFVSEKVSSTNYTFIETIGADSWFEKNYIIPVVAGQTYRIVTKNGFNRLKINTPGVVLFNFQGEEDFDNYASPTKYFYVPLGTTEVAFADNDLNSTGSLRDNTGTLLPRVSAGVAKTFKVIVPAGQDGKVWRSAFGSPQWKLISIPNYVSLQTFAYTENPQ